MSVNCNVKNCTSNSFKPPGFTAANLQRFRVVSSTNAVLREMLADRDNGAFWVVASAQTTGKGRRNRAWQSPAGAGIYASFAFAVDSPHQGLNISQMIPVAAVEAIGRRHEIKVAIKWPNDIICNGKKIGGVLLETMSAQEVTYVIAGIGINCLPTDSLARERLLYPASSLSVEAGRRISPASLLPALVRRLIYWQHVAAAGNTGRISSRWRTFLHIPATPVSLTTGDGVVLRGIIREVAADGTLTIEDETGTVHQVRAGDFAVGD